MTPLPRFMIAAAHKSSGKTVISIGLAAAFRASRVDVGVFKKGPDYIDSMWLSAASGAPCYNLDFNLMPPAEITKNFIGRARTRELSLIEANKGLFDGVATDGSDSNAELAKLLSLPVILVIDTGGMSRGIAPLLFGYQQFDHGVSIAGVILNKVGGARHEGKLQKAIETYTDLPIVGSVWRNNELEIGERHLGLTTPAETANRDATIARISSVVSESVDLAGLQSIANSAPDMPKYSANPAKPTALPGKNLRIGIARDEAFGFYYPDDLEEFAKAGAELVPLNMMSDESLPELDGIFIGGGFPECRMEELSANLGLMTQLKNSLDAGLPCYAECGGLMYLCNSLQWQGQNKPMVGFINGDAVMHPRPQGRGYVAFSSDECHPWKNCGNSAQGHEFHYASIENLPTTTRFARKMIRGHGIDGHNDAVVYKNTVAGFCHVRHTNNFPWVTNFLEFVRACKAHSK